MDTHARSNGTDDRGVFSASSEPTAIQASAPQVWVAADGYEVRELVRRTPTNDVFLTYHRPTGTFRELLVVQRVPDVDQGALQQTMEAEAAAARAVSHVGLAPIEDVGLTQDGRLYVASARPVGRPLHTLLAEDGRLPVLRAFELGHTLVTALAVAHERKLVHGWLTADSVIVVPPRAGWPERAVVLGLGTAAAQDGGLTVGAFSQEQSHYMSPERALGEPPSFRGDVFALGSLLLAILTGSAPSVVRGTNAPAGGTAEHGGPGDIEQLLRRARAADPEQRYATAGELGTALWTVHNAWFAEQNDRDAASARSASADRGPGRRRALLAAAGVLVVVAAGAAGAAARVWSGRGSATLGSPLVTASRSLPRAAVTAPAATPSPSIAAATVPPSPSVVAAPTPAQTGATPAPSLRAGHTGVATAPASMTPLAAPAVTPRRAPSNVATSASVAARPSASAASPTAATNVATVAPSAASSAGGEVVVAPPATSALRPRTPPRAMPRRPTRRGARARARSSPSSPTTARRSAPATSADWSASTRR